jgi:aminopeptidase N
MRTDQAQPVRLSDYRVPDYLIETVDLDVVLERHATRVRSRLAIRPNPDGRPNTPLLLDGDQLVLLRAELDGRPLADDAFTATSDQFALLAPPQRVFLLDIETELDPTANTKLMGLYRSGSAYCTQCEAEGFRRITYFLDRPDVLSIYTVRIEADRADAAVLLSNGNPTESGAIEGTGRHYAVWHDPHPKPCYLFALVAGNLGVILDRFTTASGRGVKLGIYVEPGNEGRADYAMDALKRSMRWDETTFGREYDLDVFNIVAVSDFNMGAMENKGLNVFNDKYVLALPRTATDGDYAGIETVIAHEYFHNWTGNRITCRDWFQLCLKEGLTVFRDHEFSADMRSRPVRRIADVRALRASQFAEDAGPLAHNVRPDTYREINNFYTATIYEKGSEVIRMLKVLIGDDAFRRGMDLYFDRCDGTATTIEVFIACFAEVSGRDLSQFSRWYHQAGTPRLKVTTDWNADKGEFAIALEQSCAPTPGQDRKLSVVLPIVFGLLSPDGGDVKLAPVSGVAAADEIDRGLICLQEPSRTLVFGGLAAQPVVSILRGFSAPIHVDADLTESDLLTLVAHDSDSFNRWQASQTLATRLLTRSTAAIRSGLPPVFEPAYADALRNLLKDATRDPAFVAQGLSLPGEADLARELGHDVDPDAIHQAREALRSALGTALGGELRDLYDRLTDDGPYSPAAEPAGRRALRNNALDLYAAAHHADGVALARAQFAQGANMTDSIAALVILARTAGPNRDAALHHFYETFADDALVVDKWFALQAMQPDADVLARIRTLMQHPAFSIRNPNRVRSLIGSFATGNPTRFNAADGSGFAFIADTVIELDRTNAQIAARLLSAFKSWRALESGRRAMASAALRRVNDAPGLSVDVLDIAGRSLA